MSESSYIKDEGNTIVSIREVTMICVLVLLAIALLIYIVDKFCICFISCRRRGIKKNVLVGLGLKSEFHAAPSISSSDTSNPPSPPSPMQEDDQPLLGSAVV